MYKSVLKITTIIFFFYSFCTLAAERINHITIIGNKRVEKATIENYLKFTVGSEYNSGNQSESIKSLYATGLFEDINIKFSNGNLIVVVQETPFVSVISFDGNSKIKDATLRKELLLQPGDSLSKAKVQSDTEKIKEIYKRSGRFSTSVEPVVEKQENNRVKVVFRILEGPKTVIKHIYFVGNVNYTNNELSSVILTKEAKWFRFLETSDTYDPDRIDYDKHLLSEFYKSVGYADFKVISAIAELSKTKEYFTLTFSIDEGSKYKLGDINFISKLKDINISELQKLVEIKSGLIFNIKALEKAVEKITKSLADQGYPQVAAYHEDVINSLSKTVDVKFVVDKADKIFINNINIYGNVKTEDRVIRREYKIAEGDLFNRSQLEKGERNLRNLDYFEKISTRILPKNQMDRYDVVIDVEEKSTASIGLEMGYSTASNLFGRISFLERNLVGTGNYLNLAVQGSKSSHSYSIGVTNPKFLDKDLSLGSNFFSSHNGKEGGFENADQPYTLNTVGGKVFMEYEIIDDLSHEIAYTLKRDDLKPLKETASIFISEQAGKFTTSSVNQTFTYDKTDSRIVPKNGYIASISQEYAGIGGNNKHLKHEVDTKIFRSFFDNKITLKLTGAIGHIKGIGGRTVRISDRFNLGDYSLRGFSSNGVGPRSKSVKNNETGESLGGEKYYTIGTELNFPIGVPEEFNVTGAVFAEMGSLWGVTLGKNSKYTKDQFYDDNAIRASVGIGFIWITRFAPIRLDWAWPVKKKPYDDVKHFHMKFSTHF